MKLFTTEKGVYRRGHKIICSVQWGSLSTQVWRGVFCIRDIVSVPFQRVAAVSRWSSRMHTPIFRKRNAHAVQMPTMSLKTTNKTRKTIYPVDRNRDPIYLQSQSIPDAHDIRSPLYELTIRYQIFYKCITYTRNLLYIPPLMTTRLRVRISTYYMEKILIITFFFS